MRCCLPDLLLFCTTTLFLHFSCRRRNREEERESLKIILLVCMVVGLQHYFKNCICLKPCLLSSRAASTTSKAKNRCKIHNAKKDYYVLLLWWCKWWCRRQQKCENVVGMMHTSFYLTYNHPQAKNVRMAGESVGLHSEFLVGYIKITTQESYNFTSQVYKKYFQIRVSLLF